MTQFKTVTWDNFKAIIHLKVAPEQEEFVATNLFSLAQSYVALLNDPVPPMSFGIYEEDSLVGFIMMVYTAAEDNEFADEAIYSIDRFMMGEAFQNKGLGRKAFAEAVNYLKTLPHGPATAIYTSYEPDNHVAKNLYAQFGFIEFAEDAGESVARLEL